MSQPPPIAAVFLVVFDQKVGYTIAWKRSIPDLDLDGVDYKSLPSGLHAVKEDLVYFIHGAHAGVSVFVQEQADAKHRNASFAAVGALVPLSYGQLGKSWLHAEELRGLARDVVKNLDDKRALELFWKKHKANEASKRASASSPSAHREEIATSSGGNKKRKRVMSEATLTGFSADQEWPADHPALHVPGFLDTFGPLLFPLQRAALCRQRVLLLGNPSVQANANAVYMTSVLSNVSQSLSEALPSNAEPHMRSSPLFSVGIQDIASLTERKNDRNGWVACTTDDILGEKKDLYDLLVELPHTQPHAQKTWPKLRTADGRIVKASQRDLRRWTLLRRELRRLRRQTVGSIEGPPPEDDVQADSDERALLQRSRANASLYENSGLQDRDESEAVEASSWGALAYRGFMWWASAGEASAWETDELKADEDLLFAMPDVHALFPDFSINSGDAKERETEYARYAATLLVAYFRRITEGILRTMSTIVEEADDNTEEGIQEEEIQVAGEDVRSMGLDGWSEADKAFVKDMMKVWYNRDAVVLEPGLRVCGVRVC